MSDRLKTICACERFYNRDSGFVYELNRALTAEECFGKPSATNSAYYRTDALEVQPWDRRTLEEPGNQIRVMRVRHADGEDSGILFAVPLEYLSDEVPVSYMLFIVSDGTLDSQFGSLEGATCVLSYQDTPFYSTNAEICEQIYEGRGQGIIRSSLLTTSSAAYDSRRWGEPPIHSRLLPAFTFRTGARVSYSFQFLSAFERRM